MTTYHFNITNPDEINSISCVALICDPDANNSYLSIRFECEYEGNIYKCTINESDKETLLRMYTFLHLLDKENQRYMLAIYSDGTNNYNLWIFDRTNLNQQSILDLELVNLHNVNVLQA
jgi:hypothetical protein